MTASLPLRLLSVIGSLTPLTARADCFARDICGNGTDDDCDGTVDNCKIAIQDFDYAVVGNGRQVAVADVTGDAIADLLLPSPSAGGQGRAYIVDGSARPTRIDDALTIWPNSSDRQLGYAVDGGDADGDGFGDLLVSAPSGRDPVYLLVGPITADASTDDARLTLTGRDSFGGDVDIIADFDGDSVPEVVIGAFTAGDHLQGVVYVASGDAMGSHAIAGTAVYTYKGVTRSQEIGRNTIGMGDENGDGVADLAIATQTPLAPDVAVYIVDGGGTPGSYAVDDAAAATLVGEHPHLFAYLGATMASGDYDGDGLSDLIASAASYNAAAGPAAGSVFAFLGPLTGAVHPDDAAVRWDSDQPNTWFGNVSVATGDADGDGQVDVLMTGYGTTPAAYLQLGPAAGAVQWTDLVTFDAPEPHVTAAPGSFVPDWTGDGGDEIVLGTPVVEDASGEIVGGTYVYFSDGRF